jgi:ubiquitin carboxyl-terminal hydrolase 5/13
MQVKQAINAIIASDSASKVEDLAAWVADKDLEVSKHADNLLQLNTGRKVPSSNWKCEREGCDKTENLWLNLTDGLILCGRRNWDGSGGNGHALDHFDQTGFPLSVKLGTITAQGAGTVHRQKPRQDHHHL